jgi:hypothetical protein
MVSSESLLMMTPHLPKSNERLDAGFAEVVRFCEKFVKKKAGPCQPVSTGEGVN